MAQVWLLLLACMLSAKDAINPSGMVRATSELRKTHLVYFCISASMEEARLRQLACRLASEHAAHGAGNIITAPETNIEQND